MNQRPFIELNKSRRVSEDWLPKKLRRFYETREGVGLGSASDRLVRLCTLAEVGKVTWSDLDVVAGEQTIRAWRQFSAIRIGVSNFGDDIVYVLSAPSAPSGSIMMFGFEVAGPGGTGPDVFESSLLLARSLEAWIVRLEQHNWIEYGIVPGMIDELPLVQQGEVRSHFRSLNPAITWGRRS